MPKFSALNGAKIMATKTPSRTPGHKRSFSISSLRSLRGRLHSETCLPINENNLPTVAVAGAENVGRL